MCRMKTNVSHVVPRVRSGVGLLRRSSSELLALDGEISHEDLVFTYSGKTPISDMTILKVLRDMGYADVTVHGFRSTFTDWNAECTDFPKEIADKAHAHRIPNAVEAAYHRTAFFERSVERRVGKECGGTGESR